MTSQGRLVRAAVAGICLAVGMAVAAPAQGRGGGGPPPGGGGPGGGGMGGPTGGPQFPGGPNPGGPRPSDVPPQQPGQRGQPPEGPPRAGLQLGPPGQRWWDDKGFVKSLKLRPEQQAKMDAIFEQDRPALLTRLQGVQQAETQMEQLSSSPAPDEAALYAQIDRVAQAHAELEKATTHMLLQLRREMDPDQIKRLEKYR
jgi:Spy/CpxP family protein refolding chaperone